MFTVRIGSKNQRGKMKTLCFSQKNQCKVGAKEGMVSELISTTKKKPSTL
jgi:hypothetical protein